MIRAGAAAAVAVLISLSSPAEACFWKKDGYGWRTAGYGYAWRDGWGYRSPRPWLGVGLGWRGDRWHHRRHGLAWRDGGWRGDGYGWRSDRGERRGLFRERGVVVEK